MANRPADDGKVNAWKKAYEQNKSAAFCDKIVRDNPVPPALISAIFAAKKPYYPTERHKELLWLASVGWERKHAARALGISAHTVQRHWKHIFDGYEKHTQLACVATAIRLGHIP